MLRMFKRRPDPKQRLREVIGDFVLPTFDNSIVQVLQKTRDPESTMVEIGRIIAQDPGLSVRVVKLVNAPAFGLRRPARGVVHAVQLLGRSELEATVLCLAAASAIPDAGRRFWDLAERRAALSRSLAERAHPSLRCEAYTAGLLQDMAQPVLARARPNELQLVSTWQLGASDPEVEREVLGEDHGEIGRLMCEAWNFPERLTEAISAHHRPDAPIPSVAAAAQLHLGEDAVVEFARGTMGMQPEQVISALEECDARIDAARAA